MWVSSGGMSQQKQPRPLLNQQEWPEPVRIPGEGLCCVSFNEVKIREVGRSTKPCKACYASTLSLSIGFILYSFQTSPLLSQVLPQQNTTWVCISKTRNESSSHDRIRNFLFRYRFSFCVHRLQFSKFKHYWKQFHLRWWCADFFLSFFR